MTALCLRVNFIMSSQDLSTGLVVGHHITVILEQLLVLVFPECLSNGICVSWNITSLVLFSMLIFQELIGDGFQLAFHSLCSVYPFPSWHQSRDEQSRKFLYMTISSLSNSFSSSETPIQYTRALAKMVVWKQMPFFLCTYLC